ncbi:MAG: molybdenum cofactor guanylyltransferase, partial [Alphaproteobacteria bacterium]|nr:molybdenum cofactor guanylyltransferase [Alphaproteobacteria bacterium]
MAVRVAVVLLAGGQSRRMGGGDKNLMDLGGKPLLAHILDRVDIAGLPALINANGDAVRYAGFGLPVMADVVDGFAGPLAGILTGFDWMRRDQPDCTHLLSVATDAPFLPPDLLARLAAAVRGDVDIAQAMSNRRRHPVFALWSRAVA